ncbi:hypothetical protein [Dyella tabacisoli]|uniref:Fibronectin type-III domain-containing protein n=1 Tax=Dyella tabacisoli TaxID=2282381 RepID=A0A369UPK3_9GAMM|nr:hypothetical protein [Dyella tabacisoli]RDD81975.1 hypothetical protein DVJ77_09300 [Dyella tabacisoli]
MKSMLLAVAMVGSWIAATPISSHAQSVLPSFVQFPASTVSQDPYAGIYEVKSQVVTASPLGTARTASVGAVTQPVDGNFTMNPSVVYIPYSESTGSASVDWTWDETNPYFRFGCLYVVVDNPVSFAQGKVVDCENPGNAYHTTLPWIQMGHVYTAYIQAQDTPFQEDRGTSQSAVVYSPGVSSNIRVQRPVGISVSPNPATIPAGATSTTVNISWNNVQPQYQRVSWYGTNSAPPYNGQTLCLGQPASPSGTTTAKVVSGERSTLYVVPYDGCVAGTVVGSVPQPILNQVSFYVTN